MNKKVVSNSEPKRKGRPRKSNAVKKTKISLEEKQNIKLQKQREREKANAGKEPINKDRFYCTNKELQAELLKWRDSNLEEENARLSQGLPIKYEDRIVSEELGTMFLPQNEGMSDKKRWIGYATNIIGKIVVNEGAKKALLAQKSLLPIGVCEVINEFKKGDVISILDEQRNEIARGIVNYNSESCKKVIGCHSDNIMEILGFKNYDAIITRDNITLL